MNIAVNIVDKKQISFYYSRDRVKIICSLWRHQQSIVMSSAERKTNDCDTGTMCKDRRISVTYGFLMSCKIWNNASNLTTNCFCAHSSYFVVAVIVLYLYPSLLRNSGNKHHSNPVVSTETIRHTITYIIIYTLGHVLVTTPFLYGL